MGESSAPLKHDLLGQAHNPDGISKEVSAFGKRKWRDYRTGGQDVPADIGGMRVSVDQDQFVKLQDLCGRLELCKPSQPFNEMSTAAEEHVFKEILQSSYTELETIIEEVLHQKLRSSRKSVPDRKGR